MIVVYRFFYGDDVWNEVFIIYLEVLEVFFNFVKVYLNFVSNEYIFCFVNVFEK